MRIIVSIQSKRGSSRGLVHYIAHSKIDSEKEPFGGRELFNRFGDSLDVKSVNNFLKINTSRKRPDNDELHHLVVSLRPEDYAKLGSTEKERKRAVMKVTRSSMELLENALDAERITWAATVHRNTRNPHVHIAIQKQYFTKDLEKRVLSKIPREAIPHYREAGNDKIFSPGFLVEVAAEKMDEIILKRAGRKEREDKNNRENKVSRIGSTRSPEEQPETPLVKTAKEKETLRQWLLTQFSLRRSEERLKSVTEFGRDKRFLVFDELTGKKRRLSLNDLDRRAESRASPALKNRGITDPGNIESYRNQHINSELELNAQAVRRIKTILFKTTAKEETKRQGLEEKIKRMEPHVKAIRAACRKEGRKLPVPSLTKEELDLLQEHSLEIGDIRSFGYLERIRTDLEGSGETRARNANDLGRLSASRTLYSLRVQLHEKNLYELRDRSFSRVVEIHGEKWSMDRLEKYASKNEPVGSGILQKMKDLVGRSGPGYGHDANTSEKMKMRDKILAKLESEKREIESGHASETKKIKVIDRILAKDKDRAPFDTGRAFTSDQLAQIESLSVRLRLPRIYEDNWKNQKSFIEVAGAECRAGQKISKVSTDHSLQSFDEYKKDIIAGRSLAREVVSQIEVNKAKEDLSLFRKTKNHQKFEVNNDRECTPEFVSLKDVEISRRGSLLDQTIDYIFEDRHRRQTRSQVKGLIREKERHLKAEFGAAKAVHKIARLSAAEHKIHGLFGNQLVSSFAPIFTPNEEAAIELRISQTRHKGEAEWLKRTVDATDEKPPLSLAQILRDFESRGGHGDSIQQREEQSQRYALSRSETKDGIPPVAKNRNSSLTDAAAKRDVPPGT